MTVLYFSIINVLCGAGGDASFAPQAYLDGLCLVFVFVLSTWLFHPSPSAARLSVDKPALTSIMTHDHAEDLCASELGPLRI